MRPSKGPHHDPDAVVSVEELQALLADNNIMTAKARAAVHRLLAEMQRSPATEATEGKGHTPTPHAYDNT